jgi:Putative restriction endonuclease
MSTARTTPQARALDEALPPLAEGDHLDQKSFHARYEAMPEHVRAELVQGIVYLPSPTGFDHAGFHSEISGWLWTYKASTPGTFVLTEATTVLGKTDEPRPDTSLIVLPECSGQARREGKYHVGAPELAAEVGSSSASYDLHAKRAAYEQARVREYVVVVLREAQVVWLEGCYAPLEPGADGILRSPGFPGLWLDPHALLRWETSRVIDVLRLGLASPEHATFVECLKTASSTAI